MTPTAPTGSPPAAPLLDETRARFITERVAMSVASCNGAGVPSVARAFGSRVSPDRRAITLYLSAHHSGALLDDLRGGGAIAAVFSLPSTHETLQLKGDRARLDPLSDGDRELMAAYLKSFTAELKSAGFKKTKIDTAAVSVIAEAMAVTFTPTAAFVQTPGPSAGRPLERKS